MHGKSARTGAPPARAARGSEGHARVLLPCAVLLALVALLIAPVRAYADANYRTVLWSGDYASGKQYIVGADNKYDAAAYICGQTSAQVAAYDLTVRYKLSATENDFAALADSLEKDWPGWNEDTLAQSLAETFTRDVNGLTLWDVMTQAASVSAGGGIIFNQGALSLFQVKYWQDSVDCDIYAVDTTSDAVSRARDDLNEILNGGGGSGGTVATDTIDVYMMYGFYSDAISGQTNYGYCNFTFNGENYTSRMKADGSGHNDKRLIQTPFHVHISNLELPTLPDGYDLEDVALFFNNGSNGTLRLLDDNSLTLNDYTTTSRTGYEKQFKMYDGTCTSSYSLVIRYDTLTANENGIDVTAYSYPQGASWVHTNSAQINIRYPTTTTAIGFIQAQSEPDPPSGPGNWPSTPTNPNPDPEPPTVPDPPQNPEPDPPSTPVAPTPPPLEPPTNVTIPTGTTAADYTPWLRAILEQLQTLTNELASHCVHLQEEMQTSVNELQDTLIYRFNSLENQLKDLFDGLEDYLHELAEWLAEQLDFNVSVDPYDDKSVLYWLRQIYGRLGNKPKAPTTVIDPDPTEPFDFWAWLMGLIANTVGGIIGDLVGDVAGLLDNFKDKFPFSIPWDIAALLALFDGVRATPKFTVHLPAVQGWYDEINFNIDLTPYDSVAAVCRTAVNIWWVMCLVMRTDWMLGVMDNASSFGERFARKVSRTS